MTQLPKIVSTRLAALSSSEHPDADLLTAYLEGVLAGRERDQLLNHVAGCAECRQVISLALPESSTQAALPVSVSARKSWLRMPVLRWGALAAAMVVIAATILLQKHEQTSHNQVQIAMQAPAPAAPVAAPAPPQVAAQGTMSRSEAKKAKADKPSTPQEPAANTPATPPTTSLSANTAAVDGMHTSDTLDGDATAPAVEAPAEKSRQALSARNSAATAKSAPTFTARPTSETAASTVGGAARLTDFRAPSWRLSQDGLPERSFASGQWEKVQVEHKSGFRAIAATAMDVWVGGPDGVLYRSQDVGLHWIRIIPVSTRTTLSDDITAIDLADQTHISLHTSAGQTWVTSDAGKTWEIQQP